MIVNLWPHRSREGMVTEDIASTCDEAQEKEEAQHSEKETGTESCMSLSTHFVLPLKTFFYPKQHLFLAFQTVSFAQKTFLVKFFILIPKQDTFCNFCEMHSQKFTQLIQDTLCNCCKIYHSSAIAAVKLDARSLGYNGNVRLDFCFAIVVQK